MALHIAGGLPQYLQASADLSGSVSVGSTTSFSASGNAAVVVAGQPLGSVPFSYSSDLGAWWQALQGNAALVANAFKNAYNWTDTQVSTALQSLHETADQVAWGLAYAFNDGPAQVIKALTQTGIDVGTTIQTVQSWFAATDSQVASALSSLGYQENQIASLLSSYFYDTDNQLTTVFTNLGYTATSIAQTLHNVFGESDRQVAAAFQRAGIDPGTIEAALSNAFGDGEAAVYNALQSIGSAGSSVLDKLAGVFNSGAYSPSTRPWWSVPLLADVSGGSTASGAQVVQWTWNGGHNQQWYVLPTDSGFAEIANRNSGMCLAPSSYAAGASLIQTTCTGDPTQQWYLGVYPGQSLQGQTTPFWNRATDLYADVSGASASAGTGLDQWYYNGDWNQQWYFGPAVG